MWAKCWISVVLGYTDPCGCEDNDDEDEDEVGRDNYEDEEEGDNDDEEDDSYGDEWSSEEEEEIKLIDNVNVFLQDNRRSKILRSRLIFMKYKCNVIM